MQGDHLPRFPNIRLHHIGPFLQVRGFQRTPTGEQKGGWTETHTQEEMATCAKLSYACSPSHIPPATITNKPSHARSPSPPSFLSVIEPTEAGMYYNPNTKRLFRSEVYSSGRHLVCPGCYFFKYPTNLITFAFVGNQGSSLNCWTKDKQEITLEIFVQIKIQQENIPTIFDKYMHDYTPIWNQKIQMAMKQTTKSYETSQFFEERSIVTAAIKSMIESYLVPEGVEVQSVHVGQVTIPPRFEEAITTKVVTQQNAATVLMQRNVTIIESRTDIVNMRADSDAAIIVGKATAEAALIEETANAGGVRIVRQAEAGSLDDIRSDLGFSVDELLTFKFEREVRKLGWKDSVVVGFEDEYLSTKERT